MVEYPVETVKIEDNDAEEEDICKVSVCFTFRSLAGTNGRAGSGFDGLYLLLLYTAVLVVVESIDSLLSYLLLDWTVILELDDIRLLDIRLTEVESG